LGREVRYTGSTIRLPSIRTAETGHPAADWSSDLRTTGFAKELTAEVGPQSLSAAVSRREKIRAVQSWEAIQARTEMNTMQPEGQNVPRGMRTLENATAHVERLKVEESGTTLQFRGGKFMSGGMVCIGFFQAVQMAAVIHNEVQESQKRCTVVAIWNRKTWRDNDGVYGIQYKSYSRFGFEYWTDNYKKEYLEGPLKGKLFDMDQKTFDKHREEAEKFFRERQKEIDETQRTGIPTT
jgi:hypothetical protein